MPGSGGVEFVVVHGAFQQFVAADEVSGRDRVQRRADMVVDQALPRAAPGRAQLGDDGTHRSAARPGRADTGGGTAASASARMAKIANRVLRGM